MNQTLPTSDPLLWEALPDLTLNIAQTAELCGISVRQLGYWTRQGYVAAQGQGTRRTYGLEAVRHLLAIRKAMAEGASLRQALRATSAAAVSSSAVVSTPHPVGAAGSLSPAETDALAQSLRAFFAVNRHTRDHAGGLAIKLGRTEEDVRAAAEALCVSGLLAPAVCQGLTIYRHAGQERRHG